MNYGTLIDNQLHPAPRAFMLHGAMVTNPKAEHFAAWNEARAKQGLPPYLPVVDERPSTDATHYAVPVGWLELYDRIEREYDVRAYPPPPPRVFSKLRIVAALTSAGVWDAVKQLLIERGLYDLFLAAQDFREDNEYFENGKAALQSELGWTDAQVEAVLAASEGGV
jgi:hypothetical protein